jgi:hypothetical protein
MIRSREPVLKGPGRRIERAALRHNDDRPKRAWAGPAPCFLRNPLSRSPRRGSPTRVRDAAGDAAIDVSMPRPPAGGGSPAAGNRPFLPRRHSPRRLESWPTGRGGVAGPPIRGPGRTASQGTAG